MNVKALVSAYRQIAIEDKKARELVKLEGGEFRIEILRDLILAAKYDVVAVVRMKDGTEITIKRPIDGDRWAEAKRELN